MKNVVIFASGSGTNANNLIEYFKQHDSISVATIYTNKMNAGVIDVANKHCVPVFHFDRTLFVDAEFMLDNLAEVKTDLIVLAGFLWRIPEFLIDAYPDKIINLHPALLPKYGGKGMYGSKVHEAVIENRDLESGITIHFVNKEYDEGKIILQAKCVVDVDDSPTGLAQRIHQLEYEHLPKIVEQLLTE